MPAIAHLDTLHAAIAAQQSQVLRDIEQLARIESSSDDKAGVDQAVSQVGEWCASIGGHPRRHRQRHFGDLLEVRFPSPRRTTAPPILLLGHLDTVWSKGTLATMPVQQRQGRLYGPGVYDMKTGVIMALTALRTLRQLGLPHAPITLLLVSDEEVGSPVSRSLTEKLARRHSAVYVLEPSQGPHGAYKTARKGVGEYRLTVRGIAAHSGVDFQAGHSAIVELARQLDRIASFTDLKRGLTVNPGVLAGGTRANVVAAEAWVDIDVRIRKSSDAPRIEKKLRALRPFDIACTLHLSGGINRPPMERTPGTVRLFRKAAILARQLGFELQEAATGGGSDGNFTSALGLPTLDGMGAVGQGAHANDESILIDALVPRTALLASMLL